MSHDHEHSERTPKSEGKASKKDKKNGSQRVNVDIAPRVLRLLNNYLERENNSPHRIKSTLTYTDVINQALDEFFSQDSGSV